MSGGINHRELNSGFCFNSVIILTDGAIMDSQRRSLPMDAPKCFETDSDASISSDSLFLLTPVLMISLRHPSRNSTSFAVDSPFQIKGLQFGSKDVSV